MIRETYFKEDKAVIEIKTLFKGSKLIPFFGSGFTKGCRAKNGRLPDAKQLIEGIKSIAIKSEKLTKADIDEIKKIDSLKNAVLLFKHDEIIPKKSAQTFFTNIFYNTQITDQSKIRLLNLDWPHIFSFNIDDGIERVAGNYSIIKPNRKTSLEYIHSHRCLFKIHGDIKEYVATEDEELIFTWRDYIDSLEKNKAILNFMASESQQSAFLFIGCSLDNEIDLMSLSKNNSFSRSIFISKGRLSFTDKLRLNEYGINNVIYFDNYDDIYDWLLNTLQSEKRALPVREISTSDEEFDRDRALKIITNGGPLYEVRDDSRETYPSQTFPFRSKLQEVDKIIRDCNILLVTGRRFSGKTLFLFQIILKMAEYSVKYFGSTDSFNPLIKKQIIDLENNLFVFDSNYLDSEALLEVLRTPFKESSRMIFCASIGDAERVRAKFSETGNEFYEISLNNFLDKYEEKNFNKKLGMLGLPEYRSKESLLDFSFRCYEEYKSDLPQSILFSRNFEKKDYPILILIAAFGKATQHQISSFLDDFDINDFVSRNDRVFEVEEFYGKTVLVCSSSAWLLKEINKIIRNDRDAYLYFVKLIKSLHECGHTGLARELVRIDKINEISGGNNSRIFIKKIYEAIYQIYYDDPHYWLQRAKSDLLTAKKIDDVNDGINHARKVRADYAKVKNQTYFSATLVLAQLYAKGFAISGKEDYVVNFIDPCIESIRNYSGNSRHMNDFSKVRDVNRLVKFLSTNAPVEVISNYHEVREIINFFNK